MIWCPAVGGDEFDMIWCPAIAGKACVFNHGRFLGRKLEILQKAVRDVVVWRYQLRMPDCDSFDVDELSKLFGQRCVSVPNNMSKLMNAHGASVGSAC